MCNYRIFFILLCMLLINTVTIPIRRLTKRKSIPQTKIIVNKEEEKKPVIVFDLVNVLFKER